MQAETTNIVEDPISRVHGRVHAEEVQAGADRWWCLANGEHQISLSHKHRCTHVNRWDTAEVRCDMGWQWLDMEILDSINSSNAEDTKIQKEAQTEG
jgi:hypothetical protein